MVAIGTPFDLKKTLLFVEELKRSKSPQAPPFLEYLMKQIEIEFNNG